MLKCIAQLFTFLGALGSAQQETLLVLVHLKFLTPPPPTVPPAPPAAPLMLLPSQMEIFLEHLLQVGIGACR